MSSPEGRPLPHEAVALQAKFFSGLANPVRLGIVLQLFDGEKSVGELVRALSVSQGHVSNQLACLRWCGYVASNRAGRQTHYYLRDARVRAIVELGRAVLADNAERVHACVRMAPLGETAATAGERQVPGTRRVRGPSAGRA